MRERPIIFSSTMIRAILDGRKTMTRRVVKSRWPLHVGSIQDAVAIRHERPWWIINNEFEDGTVTEPIRCPYGESGDRLWVRETWCPLERCDWMGSDRKQNVNYRADATPGSESCRQEMGYQWRSPIHMPRWASRITLDVRAVRVERVQEITETDAQREGCVTWPTRTEGIVTARRAFRELWDKLNAPRGFGWDENPWIWVIRFRIIA